MKIANLKHPLNIEQNVLTLYSFKEQLLHIFKDVIINRFEEKERRQ